MKSFREFLSESKDIEITIDWSPEEKDLHKSLSKEYKIKIAPTKRMEADVKGSAKNIIEFLTSADYGKDLDEVKDEFPELF